jgi:hypothetical protein
VLTLVWSSVEVAVEVKVGVVETKAAVKVEVNNSNLASSKHSRHRRHGQETRGCRSQAGVKAKWAVEVGRSRGRAEVKVKGAVEVKAVVEVGQKSRSRGLSRSRPLLRSGRSQGQGGCRGRGRLPMSSELEVKGAVEVEVEVVEVRAEERR